MIGTAGRMSLVLTLLLVFTSSVQAFSFCFSFGGGNSNRGRAGLDHYPPPPPAFYPAYPYTPVSPAYPYGHYPLPPDATGAAEEEAASPASAPRPTLGWPK